METGNWNVIKSKLRNKINKIFEDCEIDKLTDYEKRKMIFDYLCRTVSYDYDLLESIIESGLSINKLSRNPYYELASVIDNNVGICNAISQYYKLLLECVGISSYCVITNDGTEVLHQLNLVVDPVNYSYSFDDVTSVIVGRGTDLEFFDYDLEMANKMNQGLVNVMENRKWFILPEVYISYLVGRDNSPTITLDKLPINIKCSSVRNVLK